MIEYEYADLFNKDNIHKKLIIKCEGEEITNSAIPAEKFSLNGSICADTELRFGGCEVGSVQLMLVNEYPSFKDKWLEISETPTGATETLKLGRYRVYSDTLTASRRYKDIVAYNRMYDIVNADITEWYNGLVFPISIKAFRNQLFAYLGVEQVEVELPNDAALLRSTPFFDVLLAGDVLKDVCEINACFGCVNFEDAFEYVFLGTEVSANVLRSNYKPEALKYADYTTESIDGIILSQNDADTEFYYNAEGKNLYTLATRALYFGDDEETLNSILATTCSIMSQAVYVPMKIKCMGNPCIACGDKVSIETDQGTIETYILERCLSGIQTLQDNYTADGVERYVVQQGSTDRVIRSVNNKISDLYRNNFYSYVFSNALEYQIGEAETVIIEFNVAATTNTDVILLATIPIETDLDGDLVLKYYVDAVEVENTEIRQYMHAGKGFVTVSNYFNMGENDRMTLKVSAHMEYRESVERQQAAKILSFEDYISTGTYTEQAVDTTIPGGTIEQWGIKAVLFAKGLAGTASWDGTINIAEEMGAVTFDSVLSVATLAESFAFASQVPNTSAVSETFTAVQFGQNFSIATLTDEFGVNAITDHYSFDTSKADRYEYDAAYVSTEDAFGLVTEYMYESAELSIDSGYMSAVKIVTSDKSAIESVVVE